MERSESNAFFGEAVDIRSLNALCAVAAKVSPPKIVSEYDDDVGAPLPGGTHLSPPPVISGALERDSRMQDHICVCRGLTRAHHEPRHSDEVLEPLMPHAVERQITKLTKEVRPV